MVDNLMKPRYKVINTYPYSVWLVGEILSSEHNNEWYGVPNKEEYDRSQIHVFILNEHPFIFKKLQWWEGRHFTELPKYIKKKDGDIVFPVSGWRTSPNTGEITGFYVEDNAYVLFVENVLPASEEDYKKFINGNQ